MCKKIFVVLFAFLAVFAVCWCFVFDIAVSAADIEIPVSLSSNRNIGSMTNISFDDASSSQFNSWFSPMVSAWGSPVGYLNFDMMSAASFSWEFTFQPSSTYTYVLIIFSSLMSARNSLCSNGASFSLIICNEYWNGICWYGLVPS